MLIGENVSPLIENEPGADAGYPLAVLPGKKEFAEKGIKEVVVKGVQGAIGSGNGNPDAYHRRFHPLSGGYNGIASTLGDILLSLTGG